MEMSFEIVQTMVRRAFDPETISVVVGKVNDAGLRFRVVVRDELSKLESVFHVNLDHTIAELEGFIKQAAAALNLVEGPDKIGNELVDHPAEEGSQ